MPTYRPTNSGLQTKGTLFGGFDPTLSALIAGVFMVTVMATFGAVAVAKIRWYLAVPVCFLLPNAGVLGAIFFLVLGKPPRYLLDWVDSKLLGRCEVDSGAVPPADVLAFEE